jgi:hypothetical protein
MTASANPSPAEIVAALQRGGIVEALKLVLATKGAGSSAERQVTGHVDARPKLFRLTSRASERSDLSPGEVPRSSGDVWLVLVVAAALWVGYYFFAR